jgi:hypothetical protein
MLRVFVLTMDIYNNKSLQEDLIFLKEFLIYIGFRFVDLLIFGKMGVNFFF